MLNSPLALASEGSWSVGHGFIERYPALAFPLALGDADATSRLEWA